MLTPEQIQKLVAAKAQVLREFWEEKTKLKQDKTRAISVLDIIPEFSAVYKKAVKNFIELQPHVNRNFFPDHIFVEKSPFQEPEEYDYVKNNYKATTVSVSNEFFGVTNRIFNDNNFSIVWNDETRNVSDEDRLEFYLTEDYPINDSIIKDFRKRILRKSIVDPNGVLAIEPHDLKFIEVEQEDGTLEFVPDQSELIDPVANYYSSFQKISMDEDHLCLLTDEKSKVEKGGKDVLEGLVFKFFDTESIWKIMQVGKIEDNEFIVIRIFTHNLGYLPALPLGSNPELIDGEVFYPSPIEGIIDPLDMVITDNSTLLIAKNKTAYPIKIAMAEKCDHVLGDVECDNGQMLIEGVKRACPACNGTGMKERDSIFTTYRVKQGDPQFDGDINQMMMSPPVQFVSPDSEILTFLREEIEKNTTIAKNILRLDTTNSKGREVDTATATGRTIDREELFSFIKGISDDIFDLLEKTIDIIGDMRLKEDYVKPTITRPDEFAIRTSSDITEEISEAQNKGIPEIYNQKLIAEAIDKRFNMDDVSKEIYKFQIFTDRVATKTQDDIQVMIVQNRLAKWEAILHDSFTTFLSDQLAKDPNFLSDFEKARDTMFGVAQTKANEIQPTTNNVTTAATTTNIGTE